MAFFIDDVQALSIAARLYSVHSVHSICGIQISFVAKNFD